MPEAAAILAPCIPPPPPSAGNGPNQLWAFWATTSLQGVCPRGMVAQARMGHPGGRAHGGDTGGSAGCGGSMLGTYKQSTLHDYHRHSFWNDV
jgi:hypothetical protein